MNTKNADSINIMEDKSNLQKEEILSLDYDQALLKLGKSISQDSQVQKQTRMQRAAIAANRHLPRVMLHIPRKRHITFNARVRR
jgi:hypothetical protein